VATGGHLIVSYDRYAREPDMKDAKQLHRLYVEDIRRVLAEHGVCSRVEYTGSAYEGTKVRLNDTDRDLEFDIMVVLQCRAADLQVIVRLVLLHIGCFYAYALVRPIL